VKTRFAFAMTALVAIAAACEPNGGVTAVDLEPTYGNGVAKAEVCHLDEYGVYNHIYIGDPALPAHIEHGDAQPGDPYPGMFGKKFGPACEPMDMMWTITATGPANSQGFESVELEVYQIGSTVYNTYPGDRFVQIQASVDVANQAGTVLWKQLSGTTWYYHDFTVTAAAVYDGGGYPCADLSALATASNSSGRVGRTLFIKICDVADAPTMSPVGGDVYENRWDNEADWWKYYLVAGDIEILGS
jgi:hypothetical protein